MPVEFARQFQGLRRVLPLPGAKIRVLTHRRSLHYLGLLLAMLPLSLFPPSLPFGAGASSDAAAEMLAANLAMLAGLAALLQNSVTRSPLHAFLGSGFLGAAMLDGAHVLPDWGQPHAAGLALTSSGSRWFLPLWIRAGVWAAGSKQRTACLIRERQAAIWLAAGGVSLLCLLGARRSALAVRTPEYLGYLISAALFFGAIEALLRRKRWPSDTFEHCLVLSLILGFALHTLFAGGSRRLYDPFHTVALYLKSLSYLPVLVGLAISLRQWGRIAERQTQDLAEGNESSRQDVTEHRRTRKQLQELNQSVEQSPEERTRKVAKAESATLEARKSADARTEQGTNDQLRGGRGRGGVESHAPATLAKVIHARERVSPVRVR